jgi:uncharacterized protein (TIGR00255 family)
MMEAARVRFRARVEELLGGAVQVDVEKLRVEAATAAERADVTEELVRLESHLGRAGRLLEADGPAGREMEFTLQEMGREVNTVAAKASDERVSELVIEVKTELERIREQVQNVV